MANGTGKQSETVSQTEINGILWKACDTFRGASKKTRIKSLVIGWFRKRAEVVFRELFDNMVAKTERHGITADDFEIRRMKNRWGSCTKKGHILLNPELIIAPKQCIEYEIVHELCHLQEHNHGPAFYRLLQAPMPGWEQRRERLNWCAVNS